MMQVGNMEKENLQLGSMRLLGGEGAMEIEDKMVWEWEK